MENKKYTRQSSMISTRRIISHEHLNPNGILFGGYLMCWIDEIAFMCACRYTGKKSCVTVNIDNISFKFPLKLGEQIFLSAQVNYTGKTSMEVEVRVEKENPGTGERLHTNSAFLTFVCLNEQFKPMAVPEIFLENSEDEHLFWQARLRSKVRKRLAAFIEKQIKEKSPYTNTSKIQEHHYPPHLQLLRRAKYIKEQMTLAAVKKRISHLLEF